MFRLWGMPRSTQQINLTFGSTRLMNQAETSVGQDHLTMTL